MATPDPSRHGGPSSSTVNLSVALEAALRRAALAELEGGADQLRGGLASVPPGEPISRPDEIDRARARLAHAGLLLDELGYAASDQPIGSVKVPAVALDQVARRALDDLDEEIRGPGLVGHQHSPDGLRASADIWEELEHILELAQRLGAPADASYRMCQ